MIPDSVVYKSFGMDNAETSVGALIVNERAKVIIATLRGSSTMQDWESNLDIGMDAPRWANQTPFFNIRDHSESSSHLASIGLQTVNLVIPETAHIHDGFQQEYVASRKDIQSGLLELVTRYPDFDVVFTGHSLGGATASIAAVDFIDLHGTPEKVYLFTFGQPRVGSGIWADWFDSIPFGGVYRITRARDPVPRVPPIAMGYRHFKQEYGIDDSQMTVTCDNSGNAGEVEPGTCSQSTSWWMTNVMNHMRYFDP
eukprot:jgi/Hompol1/6530/HPOL_005027-RA